MSRESGVAGRTSAGLEFPADASISPGGLSRRDFVRLLGASAALAGAAGCTRRPDELILPYVHQPPELTPGEATYYATAMTHDGLATGLLVEAHDGRPTKVEGNPDHPTSLGAAGVYAQASVLSLYDPHRSRRVLHAGRAASWRELAPLLAPAALRARAGARGAGLRVLLEPTASPLTLALVARLRDAYPDAGVHVHAPFADPTRAADDLLPQYDLRTADVVLALDADFLASGPAHLRLARQYAERRRAAGGPNRLYAIESRYSVTGATADHRLAVRPGELAATAATLLGVLDATSASDAAPADATAAWLHAVARDLAAHRGRCVVLAGDDPALAAAARALNAALDADGALSWYIRSPLLGAGDAAMGLAPLVAALGAGEVETLLVLGGNPAYTAPADLALPRLLAAVPTAVHLGLHANETARACAWHVPALHYLEQWGDARAHDGTASIVQPLVAPLVDGRTADELLAVVAGAGDAASYDLVRAHWRPLLGADAEQGWRDALRLGVIAGTAAPRAPSPAPSPLGAAARTGGDGLAVVLVPCARVHDGRYANNAWLQELPDPVTSLTWGNAALLAPATAARLGVASGDVVALRAGGRELRIPALIVPGTAPDTAIVAAGYGRDGAEDTARGVGVDAGALFTSAAPHLVQATAAATGAHVALALTQTHWRMEGRGLARTVAPGEPVARPPVRRALPLYEREPAAAHQWAMTIDLDRCTGCSACVVACQAENNVPVVGRDEVLKSREMHWLRVDRYVTGSDEAPGTIPQPMLCQHCENAPCEYVCPVEATVHSADGLNEMVYNRCVGTRFCSNNCPYKVRRFNFFDYTGEIDATAALVHNPDVTVRERGVMEKCTFCVQRIREGEIAAGVAGRALGPNDVRTACQQACPTQAIVFGSLTGAGSDVARSAADPRAYAVLDELGTEPRVRYLARVRNANPALAPVARAPEAAS